MPRLTSEKYQKRKEGIIREGIRLFMAKGYNATSIKDITDAAGIPKGSFFNYFSTKESFAAEVIEFWCKDSIPRYRQILQDETMSPVDRIRTFYDSRVNEFIDVLQFRQGSLFNGMCQEMADQSEMIADALKDSLAIFRKEIENTLWLAQEAGEVGEEHHPADLALFLENSFRGTMVTAKAIREVHPFAVFRNYLEGFFHHT